MKKKTCVYTWYMLSNILGNSSMRPNSLTNTTVEDPVFNAWTWNKARQVHIRRVEIKKFVPSIFHCVLPSGFSQSPGSAPPPAYAARLDQNHRPRKYHVIRNSILVLILRNKTIFLAGVSIIFKNQVFYKAWFERFEFFIVWPNAVFHKMQAVFYKSAHFMYLWSTNSVFAKCDLQSSKILK